MALLQSRLELHGEENIPRTGVLIVANRLSFEDVLHIEKLIAPRRIVFLIERGLQYDPLLQAHLEKADTEAVEFECAEGTRDAFRREIAQMMQEEAVVLFIPGIARTRVGQSIAVSSAIVNYLAETGAPLLPLFVDHPEDTCLRTEDRQKVARIVLSFGQTLRDESATQPNVLEEWLAAGETAFSSRPILDSHLAYEILKGLKKHGTNASVIDGNDGSEVRYDKVLAAAIAFSRTLRKATRKMRVGILLPPGKGGLVANIAVLLAGKIPVNLNFTAGENAVQSCIRQADLDKFITADPFVRKMPSFPWPPAENLIHIEKVLPKLKPRIALWLGISKLLPSGLLASALDIPKEGGRTEAVLLFTSGSSGDPKGVALSHRNLIANVNQFGARIDLKSDDSVLGCLPLFHSFGCTVTMWYPVMEGVTLVTYPSPLEPAKLASLIENHQVNLLVATPTFLRGYMRRAKPEQLESLKLVITGAEKLPTALAQAFEEKFGRPVLEGYGLTETSPVTNVNLPDPEASGADDQRPAIPNARGGSVGLFIPGVAARITDPDTHEPRPLTESGMIWLRGANVFDGYLDQPEKTDEVIRDGWFVTGDIGRIDEDGFLYIEGRRSRFSKIGGEMVPHETVENAINAVMDYTGDERHIAIMGVPDEAKGEALVILSSDRTILIQRLREMLLAEGLPALWIPKKVIDVDAIPILASGKLDIKSCEKIAREAR